MSHEDVAVQRQFCAKFINQCVKPYTKCFRRLLCAFYPRALLVIYAGIALKLEKLGSIFFKNFNLCSSLPSVVTDNRFSALINRI